MRRMILTLYLATAAILLILTTQGRAEDRPLYSARETVRNAQVGTFSPRLAAPSRVILPAPPEGERQPNPSRYDRMECRPDLSRPLDRAIICEPWSIK